MNTSKIASVCAYVDLYRPDYVIFENVVDLTRPIGGIKEQNVFAQVVCALVGMGYQVKQFMLDAWSFGAPQSRTRIFISAAAPGLHPLESPPLTHSHPPSTRNACLGRDLNDMRFAERRFPPTPFQFVSAFAATQDLPDIGDDNANICVKFPDHRTSVKFKPPFDSLIPMIPRFPRGSNLSWAKKSGRLAKPILERIENQNSIRIAADSRSWSRIHPEQLLPTITTRITPACSFIGRTLHWDQHRILTIMEAKYEHPNIAAVR